jgi:hypothetical protein
MSLRPPDMNNDDSSKFFKRRLMFVELAEEQYEKLKPAHVKKQDWISGFVTAMQLVQGEIKNYRKNYWTFYNKN